MGGMGIMEVTPLISWDFCSYGPLFGEILLQSQIGMEQSDEVIGDPGEHTLTPKILLC
jgi:hypothetical protein